MIVELVRFKAPPGATLEGIREHARTTLPHWQANPALVRKHYMLSEDRATIAAVYVWRSRAAAQQAHDAAWIAEVQQRTGSAVQIERFDMFMLLDNAAGGVATEFAL